MFHHTSGVAPMFDPVAIENGDWERIAKNAAIDMANVREVGPFVRKWERAWRERLCGVSAVESDGLERAKDTHRHEHVEADNRVARRLALAFPFISILVLPL